MNKKLCLQTARSLPQKSFIRTVCRTRNAGKASENVSKLGIKATNSPAISKRVSILILRGCRSLRRRGGARSRQHGVQGLVKPISKMAFVLFYGWTSSRSNLLLERWRRGKADNSTQSMLSILLSPRFLSCCLIMLARQADL